MFANISMLSADVPKECTSWHNLGARGGGTEGGGTSYAELATNVCIRFIATSSSGVCIGPKKHYGTTHVWHHHRHKII
jgi:hypothetical protein